MSAAGYTDWDRTEAMTMSFLDRSDAGRRLANRMLHLRGEDVVVLALPRGAVPVAAPSACAALAADADEVICLETPGHFLAIGEWYQDFSQTSDREVVSLLQRAAAERGPAGAHPAEAAHPAAGSVGAGGPAS